MKKRAGEALTSPGNPLANLTTINLSRKRVRNFFRPNVCGKYALQGSSRALYTPLDPTHKECTWPVPFQEAGYAVLIGSWVVKDGVLWSGGVIWTGCLDWRWCCDLMVWFGGRVGTMVCCGIRMWWSDLGCDLIVWWGGLIDWLHGLIWRCARGRWSDLTAENWKDKKLS